MLGMTVRNGHKHHVNHMTTCSFPPPRTSRMQAARRIHGLDNQPSHAVGATVLRGFASSSQWTSRPSRRPPHRRRRPADGLVIGHGTEGNTAPHRDKEIHAQRKRGQACDRVLVHVALVCPHLPAMGWKRREMCVAR